MRAIQSALTVHQGTLEVRLAVSADVAHLDLDRLARPRILLQLDWIYDEVRRRGALAQTVVVLERQIRQELKQRA